MKGFYFIRHIVLLGLFVFPAAVLQAGTLETDSSSAVVLAYHRIGEDAYPDTNLRTEQFREHIKELTSGGYHIMGLPDIIAAIKNGDTLQTGTVAITFEGGYKSILRDAVPLLLEKNIPFTVFYAADQADGNLSEYLNWHDLESLHKHPGVTLGILPSAYVRLYESPRAEILHNLNSAQAAHQKHFGGKPRFFSYPFGEYSAAYKSIIAEREYDAAFGLHSGTVYPGADMQALPRFTMTEKYGDLERFRLVSRALAIPASDIEPADPLLDTDMPAIGFSVDHELADQLKGLACFVSGQKNISQEIVGDNRIEIRMAHPLDEERVRVNCTMPGPRDPDTDAPRWRWLGMLLLNKPSVTTGSEQAALPAPQE